MCAKVSPLAELLLLFVLRIFVVLLPLLVCVAFLAVAALMRSLDRVYDRPRVVHLVSSQDGSALPVVAVDGTHKNIV